jgi:L-serine dehydratase
MALSAFDLYSVGIGPSSSHTVGPMRAAKTFVDGLAARGQLDGVRRVRAELFGSLGATGHGHGSPKAVVLGLEGEDPATTDTDRADLRIDEIRASGELNLGGTHRVTFEVDEDLLMHRRKSLPAHPNGMTFAAYDESGEQIDFRTYYSVGGGFVVDEVATGADRVVLDDTQVKFPFTTGDELLAICEREGLSISDVMLANEQAWRSEEEIRAGMLHLWSVMEECVERGFHREGVLPGGLKVPRRAPALDWVNLYALAVNEENAAGGRVVTAPTNGAAGIIPAVLHYYDRFCPGAERAGHRSTSC